MLKLILVFSFWVSFIGYSQVNELWNTRYNSTSNGTDQPVDMVIDATGNTYITGISNNGTDFDVVTIKYDPSGAQIWSNSYGGLGLDEPRAMTIDNAGNILVVGSKFVSGGDWDIFVQKINGATGLQVWQQTYTGSALFDLGNDVAVDASNNVFVAGTYYQNTSNLDYILLKYNSAGSFQWANNGGSTTRADEGLLVEIDNSGNAILGGTAEFTTSTTYFDFRVMKINTSGTTVWTLTEDSGFGKLDKPKAMALDAAGNIHIGGSGFTTVVNLEDMLLMKISTAGALLWKNLYTGNSQANDFISALCINNVNGDVFVTGRVKTATSAENYHTRAYNSAGTVQWSNSFTSAGNNFDEATDIAINNGFLYVTGYSFLSGQGNNYNTLKYDLLGNEIWRKSFNHTANQSDKSNKILLDNQENIIVTGSSYGSATTNVDFATIKYCQLETTASPDTAICIGTSIPLTAAATGGFNYIWSVESGTPISASTLSCTTCQSPIATPDTTTVYVVRSENTVGCIDFDTVVVSVNIAIQPIITASPALAFCIGDSTTLSLTQSYSSYTWSNGGTAATKTVTDAAQQIVTIVDANGCESSDTVNTTHFTLPAVDAGSDQTICNGQTAQLQATGATSYLWSTNPALSQFIISNPVASPSATQSFSVTGTDNNGCSASDIVTITVNALPNVTASGGSTICVGDTANLLASGASTYTWNNVATLTNSNIPNPQAFPSQNTTYTVTGVDGNNCQAQASITINTNPLPFISAGVDQTICSGNSANLFATGGSMYQWQANPFLSSLIIANPVATPMVTTNFIVFGTNASNCSNTDTIQINVNSVPNVNAGQDTSVCLFESITLNATGAVSYSWNPTPSLTGNNISNPSVQPVIPTTYTVTGTSANGCSASDDILVNIYSLPNIDAGPNLFVCNGDSIQLSVTGGVSYLWNFDNTLSQLSIANPFANPLTNTSYFVTGTDVNGCENTDNVLVSINSLPSIFAGNDFDVCENETAQLQASGGVSYLWDNTSSLSTVNVFNPTTNPLQTSEWFFVTGFDNNNCSKKDSILITVNPLPSPPVLTDTFPNIISSYVFGNKWFYNGTFNSSLLNDTINYVTLGNLGTYSATHTDFNGCTSLFSNNIEITQLYYDVSIPQYHQDQIIFTAYPNPVTQEILNIDLVESVDKLIISDLLGKIVYEQKTIQSGIKKVNLANLENGIYVITIFVDGNRASLKVVKQN